MKIQILHKELMSPKLFVERLKSFLGPKCLKEPNRLGSRISMIVVETYGFKEKVALATSRSSGTQDVKVLGIGKSSQLIISLAFRVFQV